MRAQKKVKVVNDFTFYKLGETRERGVAKNRAGMNCKKLANES